MAYYTDGYQAYVPDGYRSRDGVAAIQRQLNAAGAGLKVDGIWGPRTNAAYTQPGGGAQSPFGYGSAEYGSAGYGSTGYDPAGYGESLAYGAGTGFDANGLSSLYQQALSMISPPLVSYGMPSRAELTAENANLLRPGYEHAIDRRQKQTLTNRAEIDVDAHSRGMGRSSYVTDVKDRAMDAEADDIARLEGEYAAALAAAVQEQYARHMQNKLAADQYNAQALAAARTAALQYASDLYKDSGALARQQADAQTQSYGGAPLRQGGNAKSAAAAFTPGAEERMRAIAKSIYRYYGGSAEKIAYVDRSLIQNKVYDAVFAPGATDYVRGCLQSLLQYGGGAQ
jgi:hypothetical protein